MKKALSLILVLVLCLGLCACGGVSKTPSLHKILGVFLLDDCLIVMDDFSNDAKNRTLEHATLTIGPNEYSSSSNAGFGSMIHKYTRYYYPNRQDIPGGSPTIRVAFAFKINKNDLSNDKATMTVLEEKITIDLNSVQKINTIDGIYAVEDNPQEAQMVDSSRIMLEECDETLGVISNIGRGYYDTGDKYSFINRRLSKFFNEDAQGGMSIHGEGGNDPSEILDSSLMSYDISKVREIYPELVTKLNQYIRKLRELNEVLEVPGNKEYAGDLITDMNLMIATLNIMFDKAFHCNK